MVRNEGIKRVREADCSGLRRRALCAAFSLVFQSDIEQLFCSPTQCMRMIQSSVRRFSRRARQLGFEHFADVLNDAGDRKLDSV